MQRYNPNHQYEAFAGNATAVNAINSHGIECLPLILVDGEIVSYGGYPSKRELAVMAGLEGENDANHPELKGNMTMETKANSEKQKKGLLGAIWESMNKTGGCCGSGGSCCGPTDPNHGSEKTKEKKSDRHTGGRDDS